MMFYGYDDNDGDMNNTNIFQWSSSWHPCNFKKQDIGIDRKQMRLVSEFHSQLDIICNKTYNICQLLARFLIEITRAQNQREHIIGSSVSVCL